MVDTLHEVVFLILNSWAWGPDRICFTRVPASLARSLLSFSQSSERSQGAGRCSALRMGPSQVCLHTGLGLDRDPGVAPTSHGLLP